MDKKECGRRLEKNLDKLYGWAVSRLYDKSEAEDLTGDIICAVLSSVHTLKNDDAFYGFMWRIAENVLGSRIRRQRREDSVFDRQADCVGACFVTPETDAVHAEQINLLRRELSLLSRLYRETAVLHYFHGRSCREISEALGISSEMVRYYLFRTREILKEGIDMTREYGEKSYDPGTFCMDFWGGGSNGYWEIFERRLPGNILLAAYEKPLTVSELAGELGVSAPYLEDEIEVLLKHGFLSETGGKYRTDIIIFTDEYEKAAAERFRPVYTEAAGKFAAALEGVTEKIAALDFYGNDRGEDFIRLMAANIALLWGMLRADKAGRKKYGEYPPLSNGSFGFLFGYDNNYVNHHFNGIFGKMENLSGTAWVSVENYRALEDVQRLNVKDWHGTIAALTGAVLGEAADGDSSVQLQLIEQGFISVKEGRLTANFPVFRESLEKELEALLEEAVETVYVCTEELCAIAEEMLIPITPKALRGKCGQISRIHYQMDVMAFIMESLLESGQLKKSQGDFKPTMFGVITGK